MNVLFHSECVKRVFDGQFFGELFELLLLARVAIFGYRFTGVVTFKSFFGQTDVREDAD
ncbi:TPA: hypothetical protein QHS21_002896 [Klebsiella michiganensis]|nr:hypothetical protein [Klebsiella michiganensis]HDT5146824.1 hypothetical protein [Klebsiella michiganensis]